MSTSTTPTGLSGRIKRTPLQAAKFVGILIALVVGVAGFFRLIDTSAIIDGPTLGDPQFLAMLFIPLVSVALVVLVFAETLVSGYRGIRADTSVFAHLARRPGYTLLRGLEAGIAIVGVTLMAAVVPVLVAESTPAPVGVGIMLLLVAVGVGILVVSFLRASAELFVYGGRSTGQ